MTARVKDSRLRRDIRRIWRIAAVCLWVAATASAAAEPVSTQTAEYEIKGEFLCKFGNYVEWPSQQSELSEIPFGIGVVASDVVVDELTRVARGQTVNGQPIIVRKLVVGDRLNGLDIL